LTPVQLGILIAIFIFVRLYLHFNLKRKKRELAAEPAVAKNLERRFRGLNETLDSIIIAGITALFLINFVVQTFYIPSGSMEPTLKIKDFILVNKFIYRFHPPQRKDIIVFHPPPAANANGKDYIKRVIAIGGDTIEVKDGKVYLNGKILNEPYIAEPPWREFESFKVPENSLFVMGDNRNNSEDSRFWGVVPLENVIGKAFVVLWPIFPECRAKILR